MLVKYLKVKERWNLVLEYIKIKVTSTLLITPFKIIFDYVLTEINQPINTTLIFSKKYILESLNRCQCLNLNGFIYQLHQVYSE